jgi:hypothetical protein
MFFLFVNSLQALENLSTVNLEVLMILYGTVMLKYLVYSKFLENRNKERTRWNVEL